MAGRGGNGKKADTGDLTLAVLQKIHGEMAGMRRETRQELGALRGEIGELRTETNRRLDQTNQRLDQTNQRLERVEQGLVDLGKFMREIALELTKYEQFHAHHIEILEKDVQDVRERLLRVEDRLPPR